MDQFLSVSISIAKAEARPMIIPSLLLSRSKNMEGCYFESKSNSIQQSSGLMWLRLCPQSLTGKTNTGSRAIRCENCAANDAHPRRRKLSRQQLPRLSTSAAKTAPPTTSPSAAKTAPPKIPTTPNLSSENCAANDANPQQRKLRRQRPPAAAKTAPPTTPTTLT